MWTLVAVIVGSLLAVFGFEYGDAWPYRLGQVVGWLGTFLTITAAFLQYADTKSYELPFNDGDWKPDTEGYRIDVPRGRHGKPSPVTCVYQRVGAGFQEVGCDIEVNQDRSVTVRSNLLFGGKIVIK